MARLNNKMKASPKAKTIKVAFWNKDATTDFGSGVEAIERKKKGGHSNKHTNEFLKNLEESGEW